MQLRRLWRAVSRWRLEEAILLIITLAVLALGYGFARLAYVVDRGGMQSFEEHILLTLRRTDDAATPIGPLWLREAGHDVTALGSPVLLLFMVLAVMGFMGLRRQRGLMLFTAVATSSGFLASQLLKQLFGRERPTVVPHLREVMSSSFPSGHAMLSAVVYLTLGILLMQAVPERALRLYFLLWAMLLTLLVGASRVYLGVHYPTDVIAGWMAGIAWALIWWVLAQIYWRKSMLRVGEIKNEANI